MPRAFARPLRLFAITCVLLVGVFAACARSIDKRDAVHVLTADAQVNPVLARYIDRGIDEAERTDARAVVIRLDTPGGLVSSMEDIVERIGKSRVPVIVYVWPGGGKAASAGTFITMSAHVAAMAPDTRIGAAHPVSGSGGDIEGDLGDKVENDAAALARSIAQERGRNVDWAERAVRESVSATASEAVDLDVVDFTARDLNEVLAQAEGRRISIGGEERTLQGLADAQRVSNGMTIFERVLLVLSDPNIAFLLLSLGGLALLLELLNPGTFIPGIAGSIMLIVAFFALGTLPVNYAGVALIGLAFVLFAAEILIPGFGALGIGGAVALIAGGLLLTSSDDPEFQVSRWLVIALGIIAGAFFASFVAAVMRSRRMPAAAGVDAMIGLRATARSVLDPEGFVFLQGERWRAVSEGGTVAEGAPVHVTGVTGLTLRVRPAPDAGQEQRPAP